MADFGSFLTDMLAKTEAMMIIDFTVANFLSIKNEITLSFANEQNDSSNTIDVADEKFSLYPFNALYGPNASGKSNLIKAFGAFINMVERSNTFQVDEPIPYYRPFLLNEKSKNEPTSFELEFITDSQRYLYCFSFNRTEIVSESLNFYPEGKVSLLFSREKEKPIKFGGYLKGEKKSIEKSLLPNVLFLSRAANVKHPQLLPVYRYLRDEILLHTNMDSKGVPFHMTTDIIQEKGEKFKERVIQLLNSVDLNISGITLEEDVKKFAFLKEIVSNSGEQKHVPDQARADFIKRLSTKPKIGHPIYSDSGDVVSTHYFDLGESESGGTIKMYDLASEIILALEKGSVLIIDEFDSGLHPLVTQFIAKLFQDLQINRNGAQLLVATHDPLLMDSLKLDREQIWFSDKDKSGVTAIYSLGDFEKTKIRKQSSFLKWYLTGRLRAIPATDFSSFLRMANNA